MAKNKEYNGAVVQAEFDKISLKEQLEMYNNLGLWLHEKVVAFQEGLAADLNHFEDAKKTLKKDTISK